MSEELEGKRLELLREVIPTVSRVAVLWNPENQSLLAELKQIHAAASVFGMKVQALEVRSPADLEEAFKAIARERAGALLVMADRFFLHNRRRIMDFAISHRLPGIYAYRELVEAGGLMSFGPSYPGMHKRAAYFVDRILKGTKPADLPVERPLKFDLIVNLKAARALGVKIPPSLLQRADQVIE
jgi:putative ABC transport system substrate-binding protein